MLRRTVVYPNLQMVKHRHFVHCNIDVPSPADFAARNQKRGAELQGDLRNHTT